MKTNAPKICCLICHKEINIHMFNKHYKACKQKNSKFESMTPFQDYVVCGVCGKKLLEINNIHFRKHNLSAKEYDILYGTSYPRISKIGLEKKNGYVNGVDEELSRKLRKSHTLEGYIEKYGEELGTEKYNEKIENVRKSKTLEGYIEKYGEELGTEKYNEKCKNISFGGSLEGYIEKYGEELGTEKYNEKIEKLRKARKLDGFIERYGEELGYMLYKERNDNHSRKLSRYDNTIIYYNKWDEYCYLVEKYTRFSYNTYKNEIDKHNIRSMEFHLDHKVSKLHGFLNKIHPIYISSKYNLEILPRTENCKKQEKCSMDTEDLLGLVNNDSVYIMMLENCIFE